MLGNLKQVHLICSSVCGEMDKPNGAQLTKELRAGTSCPMAHPAKPAAPFGFRACEAPRRRALQADARSDLRERKVLMRMALNWLDPLVDIFCMRSLALKPD